ncbi:MAG: Crp/Fnr family transcriptional regulator [Pedobacter sp.]|nr:MAG: Crp/Fnr family transcriptional regulator [Pedobacter sp.]
MLRKNIELLKFIESYYGKNNSGITLKTFTQGDKIIAQGNKINFVYIIKEGISKCYITEENGKDYLFEFLGAGEIVGEIEAIKNMQSLCSIEALTYLSVFAIPKTIFLELIDKQQGFALLILQTLSTRLIQTSSRSSYQQLYTLEHGIAKLLQLQKDSNLKITKDDMAAYLGISVRSFNRVFKQIKEF